MCVFSVILAAPKIKTADQDLVVDAGQPLTMVVPYDAYPKAEAEWFKENEPLSTKTVDTTAEQTSFRILEAKKEDKGRYKIVLQNKHGKAEGFINLQVIGKPPNHSNLIDPAQAFRHNTTKNSVMCKLQMFLGQFVT